MKKLIFFSLILALPSALLACPFCFRLGPFRLGLVWGAVLLLPVPFLVGGALAWWVWRTQKKQKDDPRHVPEFKRDLR